MITIICMAALLLFLFAVVLFRDNKAREQSFFDVDTSTCMRGIWCIIVLLVHVPADYQNLIQDAFGSFGFIGVTFFFMTSSYGLVLNVQKSEERTIKGFWKRRLLKLLLPLVIVNIIKVVFELCVNKDFKPLGLFGINIFLKQILFFYLLFWVVFKFFPKRMSQKAKCNVLCVCVVIFSVLIYCFEGSSFFSWPVESLGFLYGILLARYKDKFVGFARSKWLAKCICACGLSLITGISHLLFKKVAFFGDYLLRSVLGISILAFILFLNSRLAFGNKISRFLGKISYEIYLLHLVVFDILMVICGKIDSGLYVILSIIATVCLSFIISIVSKKILYFIKKISEKRKENVSKA